MNKHDEDINGTFYETLENPHAVKWMNREMIKLLAVIGMFWGTVAGIFWNDTTSLSVWLCRASGYLTPLIMCFFLVEGFYHTRSRKAYLYRIIIITIISQAPYRFLYEEQTNTAGMPGAVLNAMFTVLCCYMILLVKSLRWHPRVRMLAIVSLIVMSSVSEMPIAMPAITMIFDTSYQVYRKSGDRSVLKKTFLYAIAACYFFYVYPQEAAIYGSGMRAALCSAGGLCMLLLAAVTILTFYNGKRLPIWKEFSKWFFYFLYPAHLVLLALIRFFIK